MYLAHSFISDSKQQHSQQPLILAVEDNDDNLLLISYALESLGCQFICQSDSSSTLLVAKEYQPDLIMLDILLPSFSGIEVVHYLKENPLTHKIPVLAVTALATREDKERILKAGFDDYISKPFLIEDLESVVRRLLKGKLEPCSNDERLEARE
ncbi:MULTISPECIES: response regulator [Nostocales]|uniref:response regulator n=1 Tax=Nostocales TaxID=1161 RepID=UPI00168219C9|nr:MULTISPECIES: response regulator [Nostocales]MBD2298025.1 response regulator [Nostoc sp. FACHB-190]MBD2491892.1 response regulator [Aulosira sp. FACHB-615]